MLKRFFILFILFHFVSVAQDFPAQPRDYVTDDAQVLTDSQESELNTKLHKFEDSTSTQLFIYTTSSLNGQEMSDLCQTIFHSWKIGQGKKNNGVLIGVFVNDHKFRIHTGYGMEGVLPDLLTKHIQDNDMRPYFKQNDYFGGINAGVDQLMYYSKHEYKADVTQEDVDPVSWGLAYSFNIVLLALFLYLLHRKKQQKERKKATKIVLTIFAVLFALIPCIGSFLLLALFLSFVTLKRSYTSGSDSTYSSGSDWSSSSSGWSSSDSSSDSSFDGGGGGDSGGGGSDSSW